ncbi:MAG TPA: PfkB family carbohydrate kinase, partial [Chloroflexota bacterium]
MITVVGSANVDMVARVPHLPSPGETVLASALHSVPGGKGANQAVAGARAGGDVWFVGRVGQDGSGALLRDSMAAAGVHLDHLVTDTEQPSGTALISVDDKGQNSIVVVPGANGAVTAADIDAAASVIERANFLVVQLEIPLVAVKH